MKLKNKVAVAKQDTFIHMPPAHVGMRLTATVEYLAEEDDKDAPTGEGEEQVSSIVKRRMVWYMFIQIKNQGKSFSCC